MEDSGMALEYSFPNIGLLKLSRWLDTSGARSTHSTRYEKIAARLILLSLNPEMARESEGQLLANLALLRKIAYIHMDSTFLPMPLALDFAGFIRFITTTYNLNSCKPIDADEIIPESFPNFIFEYEKALFSSIYHSSLARVLVVLIGEKVKQRLLQSDDPIEQIVEWFSVSGYEKIVGNGVENRAAAQRYHSLISIPIDPSLSEAFIEKGLLSWEKSIKAALGKTGAKPVVLYLPGSGDDSGVITLDLIYEKTQRVGTIRDLSLLLGLFYNLLEKEAEWYSFFTASIYKKILERMIELYIGNSVKVKVTENPWDFFLRTRTPELSLLIRSRETG